MVFPWLIVSIGVLIILLGIIAVLVARKNQGKKRKTDYYSFFIMGIIWLPFGIAMQIIDSDSSLGFIFIALGLAYSIIGLAHRKEWKKNRPSNLMKKKMQIWLIVGLIALFLAMLITYFLTRAG